MPYKDKKTKLLKAKMIYDERKAKGLCVACGEKNDTPERVYCSFCAKKRVMARKRYKNACDYHDCETCPYPYCKSDEKLEQKRYEKAIRNTRKTFPETNRKWKEQGLCERCGGEIEPEMKGHTCRKCRDKQNANSRRYYKNHHVLKSHNPELCSRCHKRMAVVFVTKLENNEAKNEGLCLVCAKQLGIPQVKDIIEKMYEE